MNFLHALVSCALGSLASSVRYLEAADIADARASSTGFAGSSTVTETGPEPAVDPSWLMGVAGDGERGGEARVVCGWTGVAGVGVESEVKREKALRNDRRREGPWPRTVVSEYPPTHSDGNDPVHDGPSTDASFSVSKEDQLRQSSAVSDGG